MEFRRLGHAGDYGTIYALEMDILCSKDHARSWQLCFRPVSCINSQSNFSQVFAKMSGVPFQNAVSPIPKYFVSGRSSSEVGWARMDSRGAIRGTRGVSTRNPSANIRVCLFGYVTYAYLCMFKNTEVNVFWTSWWFQPPLKPRSTGICERRTWSQSSSTSTAQLSALLLAHLSCILFARAQRCGGKKKTWRWHMPNARGATGIQRVSKGS